MANVQVEFKYDGGTIDLELLGLSNADAVTLHKLIKKAANNGHNDHVRGYGFWDENQGTMVVKGEK